MSDPQDIIPNIGANPSVPSMGAVIAEAAADADVPPVLRPKKRRPKSVRTSVFDPDSRVSLAESCLTPPRASRLLPLPTRTMDLRSRGESTTPTTSVAFRSPKYTMRTMVSGPASARSADRPVSMVRRDQLPSQKIVRMGQIRTQLSSLTRYNSEGTALGNVLTALHNCIHSIDSGTGIAMTLFVDSVTGDSIEDYEVIENLWQAVRTGVSSSVLEQYATQNEGLIKSLITDLISGKVIPQEKIERLQSASTSVGPVRDVTAERVPSIDGGGSNGADDSATSTGNHGVPDFRRDDDHQGDDNLYGGGTIEPFQHPTNPGLDVAEAIGNVTGDEAGPATDGSASNFFPTPVFISFGDWLRWRMQISPFKTLLAGDESLPIRNYLISKWTVDLRAEAKETIDRHRYIQIAWLFYCLQKHQSVQTNEHVVRSAVRSEDEQYNAFVTSFFGQAGIPSKTLVLRILLEVCMPGAADRSADRTTTKIQIFEQLHDRLLTRTQNNPEANEIDNLAQLMSFSTVQDRELVKTCCQEFQQTVMYNVASSLIQEQQRHSFLEEMVTTCIPALTIAGISTYIAMHTDGDNFLETFSRMGQIILASILFVFLKPLFDVTLSLVLSFFGINFKSYLQSPFLSDFTGWWDRNFNHPRLTMMRGQPVSGHAQMASGAVELFGLRALENWKLLIFLCIFYWNYQHPAANQTTPDLRPEVQQSYFAAEQLLTTSLLSLAEWLLVTKPIDVIVGFADPLKRGAKQLFCSGGPSLFGSRERENSGDPAALELSSVAVVMQ